MLASIHSWWRCGRHLIEAVKDPCWRQSTATTCSSLSSSWLSKIRAGVNPQLPDQRTLQAHCCQRSVLASIHSYAEGTVKRVTAVKDPCWRQSTAGQGSPVRAVPLSKIRAGVNPQRSAVHGDVQLCCQRSVLASIHSRGTGIHRHHDAVKDPCWRQSTALQGLARHAAELSKIRAGVNPQRSRRSFMPVRGCQRSVLASIHSLTTTTAHAMNAVKDPCWRQSTA